MSLLVVEDNRDIDIGLGNDEIILVIFSLKNESNKLGKSLSVNSDYGDLCLLQSMLFAKLKSILLLCCIEINLSCVNIASALIKSIRCLFFKLLYVVSDDEYFSFFPFRFKHA